MVYHCPLHELKLLGVDMIELETVTSRTVAHTSGIKRSGNFGGIALNNFSIAIDATSTIDLGKDFRKQLEAKFDIPVNYLFLTHTHTDHRNGLKAFNDVPLIASENCIKNMVKSQRLSDFTINSFKDYSSVKDDALEVEFHYIGGHTVGSSIAYFPAEKVLFSGDLIFHGGFNFNIPFLTFYQNKVFDNKKKKTGNPEEYIAAFERFLRMDIEVIVSGHGPVIFKPEEVIKDQLYFFLSVKSATLEVLATNESMENIDLQSLELVQLAYDKCEKQGKNATKHRKWLENYLSKLKQAFYTYYKS
jgi:glyoxylase-like metal-dependent hydrolase (beta-lactamase superfamily II)